MQMVVIDGGRKIYFIAFNHEKANSTTFLDFLIAPGKPELLHIREGIAIGFDALARATITGTRMAGLNGAISGFQTSRLKIPYSFPTEQLYHIDGTPREDFVPGHLIDVMDDQYDGIDDPILAEGINVIRI